MNHSGAKTNSWRRYVPALRFSLRALFIVVTVTAVLLGYWVVKQRKQHRAVEIALSTGGEVEYTYQFLPDKSRNPHAVPPGPVWLHSWLGPNYFAQVYIIRVIDISESQFSELVSLDACETLNLKAENIAPSDLTALEQCRKLNNLTLIGSKWKDEHLLGFQNHSMKVKGLGLFSTQITDEGLAGLSAFPELEVLIVEDSPVRGKGLNHLNLNCKRLRLVGMSFDKTALTAISQLRHLESLELEEMNASEIRLADFLPLQQCLADCKCHLYFKLDFD